MSDWLICFQWDCTGWTVLIIWTGTGFDRNSLLDEDVFHSPLPLSPPPAAQALPSDILPAGCFYLLWDFTLTSWTSRRAGNTKATFQSSLKDNGLPCHFSTSPHPGDKLEHWKEQQFAAGAPEPRRPYDPIPRYQTLGRWGKPVFFSLAPWLSPSHRPANTDRRVIGKTDHLLCFSFGFDSSCKQTCIKSSTVMTGSNWIRISSGGKDWIRKSPFVSKGAFSW